MEIYRIGLKKLINIFRDVKTEKMVRKDVAIKNYFVFD